MYYISPEQTIRLAESIRRDYQEQMKQFRLTQQAARRNKLKSPIAKIFVAIAMAVSAIFLFSTAQVASADEVQTSYSNALAMDYARPWLTQSQRIGYSDALAMDYAQPWLAASQSVSYSNALPMLYAQPWLAAAQSVSYSDALAMQYAQPWLDKMTSAQEDSLMR